MRLVRLIILAVLSSSVFAARGSGQEDDEDPFRPGLIGRYTDQHGKTAVRVDRGIGFTWSRLSPDRRLAEGKFSVVWRGVLISQANGEYRFYIHGSGRFRVRLGDRDIITSESRSPQWHASAPLALNFDYHPIEIEYECAAAPARIALFWSGPQFQLEPVGRGQLFHDVKDHPQDDFQQGEVLVRSLRCAACHELAGELPVTPAPALDRLAGNIHRSWIVDWLKAPASRTAPFEEKSPDSSLSSNASAPQELARRMPHFKVTSEEAEAIADFLLSTSQPLIPIKKNPPAKKPSDKSSEKEKSAKEKSNAAKKKEKGGAEDEHEEKPKTPVESGRELVFTLGCLACHRIDDLGDSGLFGGGDLSRVAQKRPADFFERWLEAPESANVEHRMPVFELTNIERQHIASYLATKGSRPEAGAKATAAGGVELGRKRFAELRCTACHRGTEARVESSSSERTKIGRTSNWDRACVGGQSSLRQPHFELAEADRIAIREFVSNLNGLGAAGIRGESLLVENNCVSCHLRDSAPGLAPKLTAVAAQFTDYAPLLPAMTPPPLSSVGDKLYDTAMRDAIRRSRPPHRPYLLVRMPKFGLSDDDFQAILDYLVIADRIPDGAPGPAPRAGPVDASGSPRDAVGSRLVTPDGFGCTSCHQIGSVLPANAPLNARGPDLSMLGQTIRREWFDRWVRNPSRIVPRMEMPSVQVAVRGVLEENLDIQIAAVWDVLNRPGFEPPKPNPVRTVRHSGTRPNSRPSVITDVVRRKSVPYVKPLLIGLSNRHNVMFDLETAKLAAWSVGDVARQRTEGKSWYWENAGEDLLYDESPRADLSFSIQGKDRAPKLDGPFLTELDSWSHDANGLQFRYRLHFDDHAVAGSGQVTVNEMYSPLVAIGAPERSGFRRTIDIAGLGPKVDVKLLGAMSSLAGVELSSEAGNSIRARVKQQGTCEIRVVSPASIRFERDMALRISSDTQGRIPRVELEYLTDLPVDRFPFDTAPLPPRSTTRLNVVPGFFAERLPLSDDVMPTALAWRPDGTLVIASLKGQVWLAQDTDHDGSNDTLTPFSDDLAAPYGLFATNEYVDVINKYALLRLHDEDQDGRADRTETIASGWGHTTDYHDWAVGLPRDEQGNYYVALPCQQDQRSQAAATLRGEFLRLLPRQPTSDDPRRFSMERISRGHRFPMGIAMRRDGELFVTDNQGNYNPFNELNHIRPGAHFGFINAIEKSKEGRPPLTPPAIDIPHPWTRSVNGICFLDTPLPIRQRLGRDLFGPFEGHLIGCEYDTRRLIRMTLESVGETIQGAAYPFSYDQPPEGPPLLGPIVCSVGIDGDLYVGGVRDSGWGGANNIGEVVRLRLNQPENRSRTGESPVAADKGDPLPNGIREMRVTRRGFVVEFIAPVDPRLAAMVSNYAIASYTRESTPAYGGPDIDLRTEKILHLMVSNDCRSVTIELPELRAGYVYELHVKNLTADGSPLFPAEAHYTVRAIP